jgi:hypothetical protein
VVVKDPLELGDCGDWIGGVDGGHTQLPGRW